MMEPETYCNYPALQSFRQNWHVINQLQAKLPVLVVDDGHLNSIKKHCFSFRKTIYMSLLPTRFKVKGGAMKKGFRLTV